jgi:DNA-binding response OmpR family regulator
MAIVRDRRSVAVATPLAPSRLRQLVLVVEPSGAIARILWAELAAAGLMARRGNWAVAPQFDAVLANVTAPAAEHPDLDMPVLRYCVHKRGQDVAFSLDASAELEPFEAGAFCRRVRARLRPGALPSWSGEVQIGPLRISTSAFRIHADGREIAVTAVEFRLLAAMLKAGGRVLSREDLLRQVWGIRRPVQSRTVDTHIKRLRSKLGLTAWVVESVRGFGYRIAAPVPDLSQDCR